MTGRAGFRNTLTGNQATRPPAKPGEGLSHPGTKVLYRMRQVLITDQRLLPASQYAVLLLLLKGRGRGMAPVWLMTPDAFDGTVQYRLVSYRKHAMCVQIASALWRTSNPGTRCQKTDNHPCHIFPRPAISMESGKLAGPSHPTMYTMGKSVLDAKLQPDSLTAVLSR